MFPTEAAVLTPSTGHGEISDRGPRVRELVAVGFSFERGLAIIHVPSMVGGTAREITRYIRCAILM